MVRTEAKERESEPRREAERRNAGIEAAEIELTSNQNKTGKKPNTEAKRVTRTGHGTVPFFGFSSYVSQRPKAWGGVFFACLSLLKRAWSNILSRLQENALTSFGPTLIKCGMAIRGPGSTSRYVNHYI
ncbi:hypothetical protein GCM10028822_30250 [Hymenobacter terrigena]